jgi:hypothetical protein
MPTDDCPPLYPGDSKLGCGPLSGFIKDDYPNQFSDLGPSELCERGWTPILLTGHIRDFLIRAWSSPDNLVYPTLRKYVYTPENNDKIVIEAAYKYDPTQAGKKPAIFIKRNGLKYQHSGIGIGHVQGLSESSGRFGRMSVRTHECMVVGSHTVFCTARKPAFTEILATEVADQILHELWPTQHNLNLKMFRILEQGEVSMLSDVDESFFVPITVGWAYAKTWALAEKSLPMKPINFDADLA